MDFDIAFSLSDVDRAAWSIIMSEFHGNKFNLNTMQFEEQKT
ncbi:hypothetical protein [Burkholderia multivorans]|nr:hypothetical protein [Burkholderia multivorans]